MLVRRQRVVLMTNVTFSNSSGSMQELGLTFRTQTMRTELFDGDMGSGCEGAA
jgi:hypothetical protein